MKKVKLYILILIMALGATSCLDKYPEDAILANQGITTVDEADQAVIGIYSSFLSGALYSGYLTLLPDLQADLAYAVNGYQIWLLRMCRKTEGRRMQKEECEAGLD